MEILQIWVDRKGLTRFVNEFLDTLQEEDLMRVYLSMPLRKKSYLEWKEEVLNGV